MDQVTRAVELASLIEQLPRRVLGNGGCAPFGETDGGHGGHEISRAQTDLTADGAVLCEYNEEIPQCHIYVTC